MPSYHNRLMEKSAVGPIWMTVIKDTGPMGQRTLLQTDGAHVEPRQVQIGREKKHKVATFQ